MDGISSIYRRTLWVACLFCSLFFLTTASAATKKTVTVPSKQSVITNSTSSISTPNGEAAYYGQEFVDEHTAGNRFSTKDSPGASAAKQKVTLKPVVTVNPKTAAAAAIGGMRGGIQGAIASVAIAAIVDAIGGVMDDSGAVKIPTVVEVPNVNETDYKWKVGSRPTYYSSPSTGCKAEFPNTNPINIVRVSDTSYQCRTATGTLATVTRTGTQCAPGSTFQSATGACVTTQLLDPTNEQWALAEAFAAAQNSEFIKDLLKASCEGSSSPSRCYDELSSYSNLVGPSQQTGPKQTSTTTSTNSAGVATSTTTNTTNTYNYTYGPNYYNYSTTTKTTTTDETGAVVSETTTDDSSDQDDPAEEEDTPSPCTDDICDGPAYVDQYEPTTETKEDYLDSYASRVSSIPIIQALGGLFDVNAQGSCPTWEFNHALAIGGATWSISLTFDYLCLPWFTQYGPWIRAVIYLVAVYAAIRIALL